jgi:hypothetical protein
MNIIADMIRAMRPAQRRKFLESNNANTLHYRLFQIMSQNPEGDDENWKERLKLKHNRNEYYQVKNILKRKLEENILQLLAESEGDSRFLIIQQIVLSDFYLKKNFSDLGFYYLNRAVKLLQDNPDPYLAALVYNAKMENAYRTTETDIDQVQNESRKNFEELLHRRDESEAYARLREKIIRSQQLEKIEREFDSLQALVTKGKTEKEAFPMQYKIMEFTYTHMRAKGNNQWLENYLNRSFQKWEKNGSFSRSNHIDKIKLLNRLIVINLINFDFSKAQQHVNLFHEEMKRYDRMLYEAFELYYHVFQSTILWATGKLAAAIRQMESFADLKGNDGFRNRNEEMVFRICLARYYFYQKNYTKTVAEINLLCNEPGLREVMSKKTFLFLKVTELLCAIEQQEFRYSKNVLSYIRRSLQALAKNESPGDKDVERLRVLLACLSRMLRKNSAGFTLLPADLEKMKQIKPVIDNDDFEYINFYLWLSARNSNINLYDLFVAEMNKLERDQPTAATRRKR